MNKPTNTPTPAQQLRIFNDVTRLYKKPVLSKSGTEGENSTVTYRLDNAKMLNKLYLEVSLTLTATHASETTYTPHEDGLANFIKRVSVQSHNGFRSIDCSGKVLKLVNFANLGSTVMANSTTATDRRRLIQPVVASSGGTANSCKMFLEIPLTTNDRDLAGLIGMQNDKVNLTVEVTYGVEADIAPVATGYTFAVSSVSSNLYADLFSVPQKRNQYPIELVRTVKQIHEQTESIIAGENTFSLLTGQTFRRIYLHFLDSSSPAVRPADSTLSNFKLILNGSNYVEEITPYQLALENQGKGIDLPAGTFIFDYTSGQGLRNLAGRRDLVNTQRLGELQLKVTSSATGSVIIGTETLTSLAVA